MVKKHFKVFSFLSAVLFITSCTTLPKEIKAIAQEQPISIVLPDSNEIEVAVTILQRYNDTANMAWQEFNQADSEKIADLDNLISQLATVKSGISKQEIADLKQTLQLVKENRLNGSSQFNNASIQTYNTLSDSLMQRTLRANAKLTGVNKFKPAIQKLAFSIHQDEHGVLKKRARYDEAAKKYNDFFWQKRSCMLQAKNALPSKPIRACLGNAS